MAEIMLPKKIEYQGSLFESLRKGLEKFSFVDYFQSQNNKQSVESLLVNYEPLKKIDKLPLRDYDRKYRHLFQGYSMYEVDGVYKFNCRLNKENSFIEERTQIVRFYFLPEYHSLFAQFHGAHNAKKCMEYLNKFANTYFENTKITSYSTEIEMQHLFYIVCEETAKKTDSLVVDPKYQKKVFAYLNGWASAVGLFVFGYIIHEMTKNLNSISKRKRLPKEKSIEEEIWVATQWGTLINRTIFNGDRNEK